MGGQALDDRAEEQGCVNLSQFNDLIAELDLDDDELAQVYEQLDERGIELSDDCGRLSIDNPTFVNALAVSDSTVYAGNGLYKAAIHTFSVGMTINFDEYGRTSLFPN